MTPLLCRALVCLYRWTIFWYPPAFRHAFADCMVVDFTDAVADATRPGHRGELPGLLAGVATDLAISIAWQWLRTGVPVLTAAYAAAILGVCEWLSTEALGGHFSPSLLASLVPIVSWVTFTLWFHLPHLRRAESVSIRA